MKKRISFSGFQKLGKVLMTPVMILPIAGILVGIGSAFSSPNVIASMPFLANSVFIFNLLKAIGNTVFTFLPIIFAVSVAVGYAKKEKGIAALSAMIGFLVMHNVMNSLLSALGKLDPKALKTGQALVMGIPSLDTGVFGGIIVGLIVVWLHNKFYNIELPPVLGIFSGTKFVPMISIIGCSILGVVMAFVWPQVQTGISAIGELIYKTGAFGSIIYGTCERALVPFGLHHFIYTPFFFTNLGGSMAIDGVQQEGALNIYKAMLASKTAMFDINISRFTMNGKVIFAMFGLPGAALAMYRTAKPENKMKVKALMIAAVIPAIFTGITEPLEYAFLFVAPVLFAIHAGFAGLAYLITYLLQVNVPGSGSFGGPFLSFIFNGIMQSGKGSNWIMIPIIGIIFFFLYYFTFKFVILKLNYKTPGREDATSDEKAEVKKVDNDKILTAIIDGLGGAANILNVDACFTRLRVAVKDKTLVAGDDKWKETGANGVVRLSDGVQIIYGSKADVYKTRLQNMLGME
ncbi:PTS transporter subunit EIIC [Clostridium sp. BJN0001]|uniref:PTS transporter subunit EIIC n=1 Tax=Clostridium sp. BJN0001 TaxID=2930219 RepID=UPI001FD522CC|nr:PTS transporter subunit EIIC [Clostridium sp. BJN0001]